MLIHIVIFTWKEGTSAGQIERLGRALDRLGAEQADVLSLRHGADLRLRESASDYALVAAFADEVAWRRYQADPAHKALVGDLIAPIQANRVSTQFEAGGLLP